MKDRRLRVFLDIFFRPNDELEKKIRATLKRPFKFTGSGQFLGAKAQRDLSYMATVPYPKLAELRDVAYSMRRIKGVTSVGFSVLEEVPLTASNASIPHHAMS